MTLILVIIAVIFTLFMVYQTVRPFLKSQQERVRFEILDHDLRRVGELAARKAGLLASLREVEFDYSTGKLTDEDYKKAKARYERAALKTMRALDELHGGRGWETAIDTELGQRIAVMRQRDQAAQHTEPAPQPPKSAPKPIECPDCGKKLEADARFCSKCGTTIQPVSDESTSNENASQKTASKKGRASESDQQANASSLPNSGSKVTI